MQLDVDMIKKGILAALPLLKLLAARTANQYDDQLVAFLEAILVADAAHVEALLSKAPAAFKQTAACPQP